LPPAAPDPPRGEVSFGFLVDPNAPRPGLWSVEEIIAPRPLAPSPLLPSYPPRPLADGFGPATCAVRIIVGTDGTVTHLETSPLVPSTPGPYEEEFLAAVREAVRTWKFSPALKRRYEPGADLDGDGKPDYRRFLSDEPSPYYLDLRFDFEIVEGKGRVRVGGAVDP
jgi:hypothetical protein